MREERLPEKISLAVKDCAVRDDCLTEDDSVALKDCARLKDCLTEKDSARLKDSAALKFRAGLKVSAAQRIGPVGWLAMAAGVNGDAFARWSRRQSPPGTSYARRY